MTDILYWHWILLGIALLILEIFLPTFTALWFGAAAVIIGVVKLVFPSMPLNVAMLLWAGLSIVLTWLWFKYVKPLSVDKTKAGLSREAILGEVGQVLLAPTAERKGNLRFPAPILGSDEWEFICDTPLQVGDRVRVIDVLGNSLVVTKH